MKLAEYAANDNFDYDEFCRLFNAIAPMEELSNAQVQKFEALSSSEELLMAMHSEGDMVAREKIRSYMMDQNHA